MEPELIDRGEMKVVGLGTKFISILSPDGNTQATIPALWDRFVKRQDEIPERVEGAGYGLVLMLPDAAPGELFYLACVEVTDFQATPGDMLRQTIPAGRHAKFTHKGPLAGLQRTMCEIYQSWLPKSGQKLRNAPHIEVYDHRFNPTSSESEFDILLPI